MIKNFHIARDTKKTLKREKLRNEKCKKSFFSNVTMTIKFFKFYFFYMEKDVLGSKF